MAKLSYTHDITERRNFGKKIVNQQMEVVADYNPTDESLDIDAVNIYQDGAHVCEISKLLDKAEGNPLTTIIEAIDWRQLYIDQKSEAEEGSIIYDMQQLKSLLHK